MQSLWDAIISELKTKTLSPEVVKSASPALVLSSFILHLARSLMSLVSHFRCPSNSPATAAPIEFLGSGGSRPVLGARRSPGHLQLAVKPPAAGVYRYLSGFCFFFSFFLFLLDRIGPIARSEKAALIRASATVSRGCVCPPFSGGGHGGFEGSREIPR